MSGKRAKKGDSEVLGIRKFFKSAESSSLSSGEPRDISEGSSISSMTESGRGTKSTCSSTSPPAVEHSSPTSSCTEQTTVTTIIITDVQGQEEVSAIFSDCSNLHNYYLCKSSDCCSISPTDTLQAGKAKFSHSWLSARDLSFDKTSGLWWLVYEENKGMFCLLCRKHNLKGSRSKSDVWNVSPSVRLRREAVQDHLTTTQHKDAIKLEMMQRISTFQKQVNEKNEVNESMLEKTFTAIYWLAKEEIANQKLISLLELLENLGVSELKYFQHRSRPSLREMFVTLGETIKEMILQRIIKQAKSFGILADEAADVAVLEQLIMFIKYVDPEAGEARTEFLVTKCLDSPTGANAEVITEQILNVLKECDLEVRSLKSFVSDGASVMTGKHNGVAARLRRINKLMLNFHCICHRLALACADTGDGVKYIMEVEGILKETWKFFENSPKRTSVFMKVQAELHDLSLTDKAKKIVTRKIKKACRTRWLSLEQSVNSVFETYIALLYTFQELKKDPLALGLLKKMKTAKFVGTIYILKEVLPCLSALSKTFQAGALNFSHVEPAIKHTQASLETIKRSQSPLKRLEEDIKDDGRLGSLELTLTDNGKRVLENLLSAYVTGLKNNINSRFDDCLSVLTSFSILSPVALPKPTSTEFKEYGKKAIETLADHFFQEKGMEEKEVLTAQLEAEWSKFKFDLESWQSVIPVSVKDRSSEGKTTTATGKEASVHSTPTPLEWALQRVVKMKSEYGYFYPLIVELAEVALSAPITNAWPERGASAIKRIKTRLRNRLKNDMLNALLQVSINGPAVATPEAKAIVKTTVTNWLQKKNRRLQKPPIFTNTDTPSAASPRPVLVDQGTQCESAAAVPLNAEQLKLMEWQLEQEVHLAKKAFFLPDLDSESDNDSAWDSMSETEDN